MIRSILVIASFFLLTPSFGEAETVFDPQWQAWKPGQKMAVIDPLPVAFWAKKPKWERRIREEREVVVSVKLDDSPKKPYRRMIMAGVGRTHAPVAFTFAHARDFTSFVRVSEYVKRARFDENSGILDLRTAAYGYVADLKIQVQPEILAESERQLRFRVIEGVFRGLSGVLKVSGRSESQEREFSEVSILGGFDYTKLPAPEFFFEFGLEVALQRMAARLRSHVEEAWKNHSRASEKVKTAMFKGPGR